MPRCHFALWALFISIFGSGTTSVCGQVIITLEDSLLFKQCATLPITTPNYTFSYPTNRRYWEDEFVKEEKQAITELLKAFEKSPTDHQLAISIARNYQSVRDTSKYKTYLTYAYQQCLQQYKQFPDSFEIVRNLVHVLEEEQNFQEAVTLLNQYVAKHSKDIRALTQYALQLSNHGAIQKARFVLEEAYLLAPKHSEIYFAAMIVEFNNVILQVKKLASCPKPPLKKINAISIEDKFFKKAIANQRVTSAEVGLDAANIFAIFHRTILKVPNKKIGKENIAITLTPSDAKLLRKIERSVQKQLQSSIKIPAFVYPTLCVIKILQGKTNDAVQVFKNSGSILAQNTDLLRLLALSYCLQLDYDNAILFLRKTISIVPNSLDLYTLGCLYVYQNQLEKACNIFDQARNINPLNKKNVCAKAAIYIQQGDFEKAYNLVDSYPSFLKDDIDSFHLNYFTALLSLTKGNKNDAFKRLKAIHAQSEYKENAKKLLAHFFKAEEEK